MVITVLIILYSNFGIKTKMDTDLHPQVIINIECPDDGTAILRKGSIATISSQDRPRSWSGSSSQIEDKENLETEEIEKSRPISLAPNHGRNQRPLSFSALMQDVESKRNAKTALEERKLRELLNTMKHVKGNTLIVLVFETILYHMCFYIADVITDIVNGYHHYKTGKYYETKYRLLKNIHENGNISKLFHFKFILR